MELRSLSTWYILQRRCLLESYHSCSCALWLGTMSELKKLKSVPSVRLVLAPATLNSMASTRRILPARIIMNPVTKPTRAISVVPAPLDSVIPQETCLVNVIGAQNLAANTAVATIGMVVTVLAICLYLKMTLSASKDTSDGIKSIGLSFSQIIYLLATFPVPWARMFTTLFQVGVCGHGARAALCQFKVHATFLHGSRSLLFEPHRLGAVPASAVCCVCSHVGPHLQLFWVGDGWAISRQTSHLCSCPSLSNLGRAVLGSICTVCLSNLCGEYRLSADVEEVCFEGRHWHYAVFLGVPMLLAYVIGSR